MTRRAAPSSRAPRTVGVEEELLLVDAGGGGPVPVAEELFRALAPPSATGDTAPPQVGLLLDPVLEFEVKQEQVEVISPPWETLDDLRTAIVRGRRAADEAALAVGARAVPVATAPTACTPHLVGSPRYERMRDRFGLTMDEQLTCGFHVHVAVSSPEEGVAVLDRIRPWLPVILAASANSPFWQSADTRFASYRYQAWSRWPCAGPYDLFGSAEAYVEHRDSLLGTDVPLDAGMVYFDARLSDHVPTVEVRIADVCLDPDDAAVLAVVVRALVETAAADWRAELSADPVPTALLRLASWRASRSGLEGMLIHPVTRLPVSAASAVRALLQHVVGGFADPHEERRVVAHLTSMLQRGTGATRQRRLAAESGGPDRVTAALLLEAAPASRMLPA